MVPGSQVSSLVSVVEICCHYTSLDRGHMDQRDALLVMESTGTRKGTVKGMAMSHPVEKYNWEESKKFTSDKQIC